MAKRGRYIKNLVCAWGGSALLYWWFTSQFKVQQLAAAAVIGLVITATLIKVVGTASVSFVFHWHWLAALLRRLPKKLFCDVGLLATALGRSLSSTTCTTGVYQTRKMSVGGADAKAAARRALIVSAVSLPPNSFAVAVQGKNTLLVHQLVFHPEPTTEEWAI